MVLTYVQHVSLTLKLLSVIKTSAGMVTTMEQNTSKDCFMYSLLKHSNMYL